MKKFVVWIICVINLILGMSLFIAAQWEIATNTSYTFERPYTSYEITIILYKWAGVLFIISGIFILINKIVQHYVLNKQNSIEKTLNVANRTCPNCGLNISGNIATCPHCGYLFHNFEKNNNINFVDSNVKSTNQRIKIYIPLLLGCIIILVILFMTYKIIDPNINHNTVKRTVSNELTNSKDNNQNTTNNTTNDSPHLETDLDRNYTNTTSVEDVITTEKNTYETSANPDYTEYVPIYDQVFNEEKQIYEYNLIGTDNSKIYFLYYKNAKNQKITASYGFTIWFDKEKQTVNQIQYYLSENDFKEFIETYGQYDSSDSASGTMYWTSPSATEINAIQYDNLEDYWPCSTLKISGTGYIVSIIYES